MATEQDVRAVLVIAMNLVNRVGRKRRDGSVFSAQVPWRQLDHLADALRAAGVDIEASNLGIEVGERLDAERKEHLARPWGATQ